jgi:hypothetical protein
MVSPLGSVVPVMCVVGVARVLQRARCAITFRAISRESSDTDTAPAVLREMDRRERFTLTGSV